MSGPVAPGDIVVVVGTKGAGEIEYVPDPRTVPPWAESVIQAALLA